MMKKQQHFFIISFFVVITMNVSATLIDPNDSEDIAYWERMDKLLHETRQKAMTDDGALKELIRSSYNIRFGNFTSGIILENMQNRVKQSMEEDDIPLSREIKIMENMVRQGLNILHSDELVHQDAFGQARLDIDFCMLMLAAVPHYDIHPLLNECFKSTSEGIRRNVLMRYVKAKNVEAIPFLCKLIEEANLADENRSYVYRELGRTVEYLTRINKYDDVAKIHAYLKKVNDTEQMKTQAQTKPINSLKQPGHETPPKQPEKSSSKKILFGFSVVAILVFIGGLVVWRKIL